MNWEAATFEYIWRAYSRGSEPLALSLDNHIDCSQVRSIAPTLWRIATETEASSTGDSDEYFQAGASLKTVRVERVSKIRKLYLRVQKRPTTLPLERKICAGELWADSDELSAHPDVNDFIQGLPFETIGRVWMIWSKTPVHGIEHMDHINYQHQSEFIYFRPDAKKRFYVAVSPGQRRFIDGYSAWFDTRQWHAALPGDGPEMSLRVDGVFTPEFRNIVRSKCWTLMSEASRSPWSWVRSATLPWVPERIAGLYWRWMHKTFNHGPPSGAELVGGGQLRSWKTGT